MKERPTKEITVTEVGSLQIDPAKLMQTPEAQAQVKALRGLGIANDCAPGKEPVRPMSTPRTDEAEWGYPYGIVFSCAEKVVDRDFARQLERELAAALEREKALRQELAVEATNGGRLAKELRHAIKQNAHDMLLTGDELRRCESAVYAYESRDESET